MKASSPSLAGSIDRRASGSRPRHMTREIIRAKLGRRLRRHILYRSRSETAQRNRHSYQRSAYEIPLDPANMVKGTMVVHVGKLVDGISQTARSDMNFIVINGNRIESVEPHSATVPAGAKVHRCSKLLRCPSLIESRPSAKRITEKRCIAHGWHSALQRCAVRQYAVRRRRRRRADESGVRTGRDSLNGLSLVAQDTTKMGLLSPSPLAEMGLELAKVLQHDLIKTMSVCPICSSDTWSILHPRVACQLATHEIYPAAYVGVDATEHVAATEVGASIRPSRLLSSAVMKMSCKSSVIHALTPTVSAPGLAKLFEMEPEMKKDKIRYSDWLREVSTGQRQVVPGEGPGRIPLRRRCGSKVQADDGCNACSAQGVQGLIHRTHLRCTAAKPT